jgi:pyruvate kinase
MEEIKIITKSKIVCTLGPASNTAEQIKALADRGMDVARINFSHGSIDEKIEVFDIIRKIDPSLAIMCDIQGPKIRIGEIEGNGVSLAVDQPFTLTTEEIIGNNERATISYAELPGEAKPGDLIFINDGLISLQVEEVADPEIKCKVLVGGTISSKKGVNLPNTEISMRVPTPKDVEDLKTIARLDPEYVAISFVCDENDVNNIRDILKEFGNENIKLISKIERPFALQNLDSIIDASDGIMVARGDLGVEIPFEQVIPAQKLMIKKANRAGKPVIVATQMLESMINSPVPTRAEVSDVYNAIADGADAVMLSAETAAGQYPNNAVETLERIIKISETKIPTRNPDDFDSGDGSNEAIVGRTVYYASKQFSDLVKATTANDDEMKEALRHYKSMVLTRSGYSARMVSKFRPMIPIIAITGSKRTARELRLVWGVESVLVGGRIDSDVDTFKKIHEGVGEAISQQWLGEDDKLVICGNLNYLEARTNMVCFFTVRQILDSMLIP